MPHCLLFKRSLAHLIPWYMYRIVPATVCIRVSQIFIDLTNIYKYYSARLVWDSNAITKQFRANRANRTAFIYILFTLFSPAVTFNINGYAETQWTEHTGSGKRRSSHTFHAREDYIATQTYLAGSNLSSKSDKHNSPQDVPPLKPAFHVSL